VPNVNVSKTSGDSLWPKIPLTLAFSQTQNHKRNTQHKNLERRVCLSSLATPSPWNPLSSPNLPLQVAAANATATTILTVSTVVVPSSADLAEALSTTTLIASAASKEGGPARQTGMDRYIQIKRKFSPQNIRKIYSKDHQLACTAG